MSARATSAAANDARSAYLAVGTPSTALGPHLVVQGAGEAEQRAAEEDADCGSWPQAGRGAVEISQCGSRHRGGRL